MPHFCGGLMTSIMWCGGRCNVGVRGPLSATRRVCFLTVATLFGQRFAQTTP